MPKPFFRFTVHGIDITPKLSDGHVSLTITDGSGSDADTAQIVIDDHNGIIVAPKDGVDIEITAGYEDDPVDFGTFTVDEVVYEGWPMQISISAQSAKAKSTLKERRPKAYDKRGYPTYGKLFEEIASRNGLTLSISEEIKSKALQYEAQSEETDSEFATRIGTKLDAAVTVKSGRFIVVKKGEGKSASGLDLPTLVVKTGLNALSYTVSRQDKPKHRRVKATWFDRKAAERKEVESNASEDGPEYLLREPYQDEDEAKEAANAKAQDLKRSEAKASFEIEGNPHARAEAYVIVSGVRTMVDGVWRATSVTHNWSSSGAYTTSLECELPTK